MWYYTYGHCILINSVWVLSGNAVDIQSLPRIPSHGPGHYMVHDIFYSLWWTVVVWACCKTEEYPKICTRRPLNAQYSEAWYRMTTDCIGQTVFSQSIVNRKILSPQSASSSWCVWCTCLRRRTCRLWSNWTGRHLSLSSPTEHMHQSEHGTDNNYGLAWLY